MTTFSRGEVVYVPFRFTQGDVRSKSRPAVVISSAAYHDSRQDVVIAGITGNVARPGFVGHIILGDWQACGLRKPSAVSGIIMTVRDSKIGRKVGVLSDADRTKLEAGLRQVFDL